MVESKPCQNNIVLPDECMTLWGEPWATAHEQCGAIIACTWLSSECAHYVPTTHIGSSWRSPLTHSLMWILYTCPAHNVLRRKCRLRWHGQMKAISALLACVSPIAAMELIEEVCPCDEWLQRRNCESGNDTNNGIHRWNIFLPCSSPSVLAVAIEEAEYPCMLHGLERWYFT